MPRVNAIYLLIVMFAVSASLYTVISADIDDNAITYQGQLLDGHVPVEGNFDFLFELYDAEIEGNRLDEPQRFDNVFVSGGVFSHTIDFGDVFDGSPRWLQVSVREHFDNPDERQDFDAMSPRSKIRSVPYSQRSATTAQIGQIEDGTFPVWSDQNGELLSGPIHVDSFGRIIVGAELTTNEIVRARQLFIYGLAHEKTVILNGFINSLESPLIDSRTITAKTLNVEDGIDVGTRIKIGGTGTSRTRISAGSLQAGGSVSGSYFVAEPDSRNASRFNDVEVSDDLVVSDDLEVTDKITANRTEFERASIDRLTVTDSLTYEGRLNSEPVFATWNLVDPPSNVFSDRLWIENLYSSDSETISGSSESVWISDEGIYDIDARITLTDINWSGEKSELRIEITPINTDDTRVLCSTRFEYTNLPSRPFDHTLVKTAPMSCRNIAIIGSRGAWIRVILESTGTNVLDEPATGNLAIITKLN